MRIDEAIHYLDRIKQEYDCSYEEDALNVAIASLEAWERVKDDIHEYETDCLVSADCADCKDCNVVMFKSIYQIIDKHLQEVEE